MRALINLVMQYANTIQGNAIFSGGGSNSHGISHRQAAASSHMHAFVSICKTKFTKVREMLSVLTSDSRGSAGPTRVLTPTDILAVEAVRVDLD